MAVLTHHIAPLRPFLCCTWIVNRKAVRFWSWSFFWGGGTNKQTKQNFVLHLLKWTLNRMGGCELNSWLRTGFHKMQNFLTSWGTVSFFCWLDSAPCEVCSELSHFYSLGTFAKLWKVTISFFMSVCLSVCLFLCMQQLWSHWMSFMKFYIWGFLKNLSRKFKFHYNLTGITGTLHEDLRTSIMISHWIILRMTHVKQKICRKNQTPFYVQ